MEPPFEPLSGGCLCGTVRYVIERPPLLTCHCHCTLCRRAGGAPYVTWSTVPLAAFNWMKGPPSRFRSSPRATREFCAACGTQLTFRLDGQTDAGEETLDVTSASLDAPNRVTPSAHIWLSSRIGWTALPDDGLARFEEGFPAGWIAPG